MRHAFGSYYWPVLLLGWALVQLLSSLSTLITFGSVNPTYFLNPLMEWISLVAGSHLLTLANDRWRWYDLRMVQIAPRVLLVCLLLGLAIGLPFSLYWSSFVQQVPGEFPAVRELLHQLNPVYLVVSSASLYAMKLVCWYLLVWVAHLYRQSAEHRAHEQALENELHTARLDHLRAQLNPHFLFNCLNNIRAAVHIDRDMASSMISQLADILRYALRTSNELVPLHQELGVIESYLALEKSRLGKRLTTHIDVDEQAGDCRIPPLLLQPLVENAVKHGVSQLLGGGSLRLRARLASDGLQIEIENDGRIESGHQGFGVGLSNSRERLALLYGRSDLLEVTEKAGKVLFKLMLPSALATAATHE